MFNYKKKTIEEFLNLQRANRRETTTLLLAAFSIVSYKDTFCNHTVKRMCNFTPNLVAAELPLILLYLFKSLKALFCK